MKPRLRYLAILAMLAIGGCKGTTPIQTLLDDPGRFDKQKVRVAGTVGSALSVMGYGAYTINDGTGSLTVISQQSGAPREGAEVGVEGEFRSAFTLGSQTAAVLMESKRFTP
ncbi:MAG TPA: hypothetical protein VFQ05_10825 [Candidatus Eisenbacteria bacterium]|nr:hypothetical protein [Candidatus Eisenbacteria bacterium]